MSHQDFSLVTTNGEELSTPLDKVKQEIEKQKVTYAKLCAEQRELSKDKDSLLDLTEKFQKSMVTLRNNRDEEEKEQTQGLEKYKNRMKALQEEESRLRVEVQKVEEELHHFERLNHQLKQQTQMCAAVPEKTVVFTGDVDVGAGAGTGARACSFDMKARIVYPMEEGTALVTFEDEEVAQKIMSVEQQGIIFGDCMIRLQVKPVQFLVPSHIKMDTHVCPRRILVSNLPKKVEESRLMDRLEIYFQKKRNGGGEVESIDILPDSGSVVITFVEENVAKSLTGTEYHEVDIEKKKHRLRVTPFLNGEVTDLQMRTSVSRRTVLLTGIPDIMDRDSMQDSLEIFFQKGGNGGGEVDAIFYNPVGHSTLAVFEEDCPHKE
ncbi:hypothetical protein AAFF_G00053120 [Aldrovandia affinis]|uniref:RRM domain-containing protein n=1 Tax=Aldrovandia affinis TaxID=143900 RepID=A0AAD7T609_9TELE|nr:hypothetical protein AAFF_G00053120 [Aldrovandia affinis]